MFTTAQRAAFAVLHTDLTFEPEMRLLLPDEVALYANRVRYPAEVTADSLAAALDALEPCVTALAAVRPDVLVWACTSASVIAGPAAHARLLERLAAWAPGAVPVTAASAVLTALAELDARRVAVATPYPPEVSARLVETLEAAGHEVVACVPAFEQAVDDWTLQALTPDEIAALAQRADRPEADAVLVSCTGIAGATAVERIERALGKPLVTSNVAIARAVRRALGIEDGLAGHGRLLEGAR